MWCLLGPPWASSDMAIEDGEEGGSSGVLRVIRSVVLKEVLEAVLQGGRGPHNVALTLLALSKGFFSGSLI